MADLGATRTEFAADSALRTGRGGELVGQDIAHIDVPFQIYMAEVGNNDLDPGVVYGSFDIPIPDYVGVNEYYVNLKLEVKVTANNGDWRLRNITDSLNGTWQNTVSAAYEESTDKVQLGTAADTDRLTQIEIWGRVSDVADTLSIRSILGLTAWFSTT